MIRRNLIPAFLFAAFLLPLALSLTSIAQEATADAGSETKESTEMTAPPETDDMTAIFNGVDLTGWTGDDRLWKVENGIIRGETTKENKAKGNTFLIWEQGKTGDFELRLSFRVSTQNNSGIQYRSAHIQDETLKPKNDFVLRGYQHEIRNSDEYPDVPAFIYDEGGKRGRICACGEKAIWKDGQKQVLATLVSNEEFSKLFQVDQWNDVVIIAKGRQIKHYINDRLVLDFTDDEEHAVLDGRLGLQLHAGVPMWAEYRDIRFRELK